MMIMIGSGVRVSIIVLLVVFCFLLASLPLCPAENSEGTGGLEFTASASKLLMQDDGNSKGNGVVDDELRSVEVDAAGGSSSSSFTSEVSSIGGNGTTFVTTSDEWINIDITYSSLVNATYNNTNSSASKIALLKSKLDTVKATLKRIVLSINKENIKQLYANGKEAVKNVTFTRDDAIPPVVFFSSMFSFVFFACSENMNNYGLTIAYLGLISLTVAANFCDVPVYMNLIAMSTLIIYIGCHKSLSLLVSEADGGGSDKHKDVLTADDAMMFPLVASCSLFGLYLAFTSFDPDTINKILSWYFAVIGVGSLTSTFAPFFGLFIKPKLHYKFDKDSFMGEMEIKFSYAELASFFFRLRDQLLLLPDEKLFVEQYFWYFLLYLIN